MSNQTRWAFRSCRSSRPQNINRDKFKAFLHSRITILGVEFPNGRIAGMSLQLPFSTLYQYVSPSASDRNKANLKRIVGNYLRKNGLDDE